MFIHTWNGARSPHDNISGINSRNELLRSGDKAAIPDWIRRAS